MWHICAQGGNTALMYVGRYGHMECAQLLLDAGADKNAKDNVRGCRHVCGCARVLLLQGFLYLSHVVLICRFSFDFNRV